VVALSWPEALDAAIQATTTTLHSVLLNIATPSSIALRSKDRRHERRRRAIQYTPSPWSRHKMPAEDF
jgi:hypothetical protein